MSAAAAPFALGLICGAAMVTAVVARVKQKRGLFQAGTPQLLIFMCSPRVRPLPNIVDEALEVSHVCPAAIYKHGTAAMLQELLDRMPTRIFMFSGHTDLPYDVHGHHVDTSGLGALMPADTDGQSPAIGPSALPYTLAFTSPDGDIVMTPPSVVIRMIASHSVTSGGNLEMVFINGCKSEAFGRALHAAGVRYVMCWRTQVVDEAARTAITAFFTAASMGSSYEAAFEAARRSLLFETSGHRASFNVVNGMPMRVPKYRIEDPEELIAPAQPHLAPTCMPEPLPSGLWLLLTPNGEFSW